MGQVIRLEDRRARRPVAGAGAAPASASAAAPPAFYFDLACPFSYLAAERVERLLGEVDWVPVAGAALAGPRISPMLRAEAELRARELRLPLSWPDLSEEGFPGALCSALWAAELGAGGRFALAALRLAFCGGYDLEDPAVLAEAAAAAGLDVEACLAATYDSDLGATLDACTAWLAALGVRSLPAVRIAGRWYCGEDGVVHAAIAGHAA